jgi:hypothetical protein
VKSISFETFGDADEKRQPTTSSEPESEETTKLKEGKSSSGLTSSVMQIIASANEEGSGAIKWWE